MPIIFPVLFQVSAADDAHTCFYYVLNNYACSQAVLCPAILPMVRPFASAA